MEATLDYFTWMHCKDLSCRILRVRVREEVPGAESRHAERPRPLQCVICRQFDRKIATVLGNADVPKQSQELT